MRRDLRDGNTYCAYVEAFAELNVEARRVAEALGPHGLANSQFRLDEQGRAKVFEINVFSGMTPIRRRAGFNEVEMVLRRILRGESIKQRSIHPTTVWRHFTETVVPGLRKAVMKVTVTGASGFVGRHLVRTLRAHGHVVRSLVRDLSMAPESDEAGAVDLSSGSPAR